MDRETIKGLNGVSYEIGTNAISTQHRELIAFAEKNNLPVTTLQKTTYIAVPEGSTLKIDDVLGAVENARLQTSQVTKQEIKLRVGIADSADTLMETRLRTKRSLEFGEQTKVPPAKYGEETKEWYGKLPSEQKANVNDIFTGYDENLKDEFATLDELRRQGQKEEYGQKVAQLALADMQDAKFSSLPTVKKYQSDPVTGIKEGDVVVATDGISVGQLNKRDVSLLTEQDLPDAQLAVQLGKSVDTRINKVNDVIKDAYFQAVDNVGSQSVEAIAKYNEIATAARYPNGAITNTDELKDFLKWEFEHKGRFRGGDETFMTLRKEVLEANPNFARTLRDTVSYCDSCYGVRTGFKEVGAGETYAQAVGAADKAAIASKKLDNVPVVVDKLGETIPLSAPGVRKAEEAIPPEGDLVSDVADACVIVGGAIVGLAPCPTAVPKTTEGLEQAPASGVTVREIPLEQAVEGSPVSVTQVEEVITPEIALKPQQIIKENDGVVVVSEENIYFVDDQGRIYSVLVDNAQTFKPKEALSLDPALERELRELADGVREGRVTPSDISPKDKSILMIEAGVNDGTISVQVAGPDFDDVLLNPSGTHNQYLQKVDDTIERNPNLQHLHQQFAERGTPVHYSYDYDGVPIVYTPETIAVYSRDLKTINYKMFADDDEILNYAKNLLGYQGDDVAEARKLIAQRQIQYAAGHETYHHAFSGYLTPSERNKWAQYVQQTDDLAIRSAIDALESNPEYASLLRSLPPDQRDFVIADEVFAHRNDFSIKEVPVFYENRTWGQSKSKFLSMFIDYTKTAVSLLR